MIHDKRHIITSLGKIVKKDRMLMKIIRLQKKSFFEIQFSNTRSEIS